MFTIYIDVLIILNIYVNYLLLKTTAKITRSPVKFSRCIASAFYGSLFSLLILAPEIPTILNITIKLFAAVSISAVAFGIKGKKRLLINTSAFFTVNFIFGGVVYWIYCQLRPGFMHFNNTYFYVNFSLPVLVLTTAVLYFAVCIARRILDSIPDGTDCYKVIIKSHDRIVSLNGLADTGNALVDFFSGSPVIVCSRSRFTDITGISELSQLPKGFRLIPCKTVSDSGVIPVFRPDEVFIMDSRNGMRKSVDAVIGFGENCTEAVFNPKLLKL